MIERPLLHFNLFFLGIKICDKKKKKNGAALDKLFHVLSLSFLGCEIGHIPALSPSCVPS